ncbi:GNAT family N-acetyltransferase [Hoylesella oralis]|uniref:GNAT family N-acetyltransferase n=1 Tax=Hoylesella oralis TaxID=28134 RepID=UPI0028E86E36|nr:GNAT family N-acetyltransferase [Hoylesella oralis]
MKEIKVRIISKQKELPVMNDGNFFHSPELFKIIADTPGHTPYMAIATDHHGNIVAHMLAIIRRRGSLLPPYLYTHGHIFGEGAYQDGINKEEVFGLMLRETTRKFKRKLCLYAEFSNISTKMFGYRHFRENGYFPISWQEIHNSLHSMPPENRLSNKLLKRIRHSYNLGIVTREAKNEAEIHQFYTILHSFYRLKIRRFVPPESQIRAIGCGQNGHIFVTLYRNKVIGGCICVHYNGNMFLWYHASKRKRYMFLHPNTLTIWHAIKYAYDNNYAHMSFLDAGLPLIKNPHRDFILSFGGKPVTKYRWFRISIPWINSLLSWIYRE